MSVISSGGGVIQWGYLHSDMGFVRRGSCLELLVCSSFISDVHWLLLYYITSSVRYMYTSVHVFTSETPNCLSNNKLFHTIQVSANITQVSKGGYVHSVKYTLKLSNRKRGRSKQIDFPLENDVEIIHTYTWNLLKVHMDYMWCVSLVGIVNVSLGEMLH